MRRLVAILAGLVVAAPADAAEVVRFVACPVYRDTDAGAKSGCWLADDRQTGARYDIGSGPIKPDWNHEVLVEGVVTDAPDTCGGVVLNKVSVSRLTGVCTPRILPPETFKGRRFVAPGPNLAPITVVRPTPPPPYGEKSFVLLFEFDQAFLTYQQDDVVLDQMQTWAKAAKPGRVVVTAYAAAQPAAISGRVLREDPAIARQRGEDVAEALRRLGVPAATISVKLDLKPAAMPELADGLAEASKRRVVVTMYPGKAR